MPSDAVASEIMLRVLVYAEDDGFVALALEMDLRGYGATPESAVNELRELVAMQISFAEFKGQAEMIWKDADHVWFSRWEAARRESLTAFLRSRLSGTVGAAGDTILGLPFPDPQVIHELMSGFRNDAQAV